VDDYTALVAAVLQAEHDLIELPWRRGQVWPWTPRNMGDCIDLEYGWHYADAAAGSSNESKDGDGITFAHEHSADVVYR
jgi:hypothetical protein